MYVWQVLSSLKQALKTTSTWSRLSSDWWTSSVRGWQRLWTTTTQRSPEPSRGHSSMSSPRGLTKIALAECTHTHTPMHTHLPSPPTHCLSWFFKVFLVWILLFVLFNMQMQDVPAHKHCHPSTAPHQEQSLPGVGPSRGCPSAQQHSLTLSYTS